MKKFYLISLCFTILILNRNLYANKRFEKPMPKLIKIENEITLTGTIKLPIVKISVRPRIKLVRTLKK